MKIVYIEWEDAVSSDNKFSETEMGVWSEMHYIRKRVGFVYQENDDNIVLFSGIHEDEEYESTTESVIKIPKSLIRVRREIELGDTQSTKYEKLKDIADSLDTPRYFPCNCASCLRAAKGEKSK